MLEVPKPSIQSINGFIASDAIEFFVCI